MKCYDKKGNEVPGKLLLASRDYPDHAIFRDKKNCLYMVTIEDDKAILKNGSISRRKAFTVAEQCLAGRPVQGGMSEAMNAMAVTMLAAIAEYEAKLRELEGLDESSLSK